MVSRDINQPLDKSLSSFSTIGTIPSEHWSLVFGSFGLGVTYRQILKRSGKHKFEQKYVSLRRKYLFN